MSEFEQGYLERQYLDDQYLAGHKRLTSGVQLNQIINIDTKINFQINQIIKSDIITGLQLQQIVDKTRELGLNVDQIIKTTTNLGLQAEQKITSGMSMLGLQTNQVVNINTPVGFQVNQIADTVNMTGWQINQIISDSHRKVGFQVTNKIKSDSHVGLQINNIVNTIQSSGFQVLRVVKVGFDSGLEVIHDTVRHRFCGPGYLMSGYLEESYLSFQMCADPGFQVRQISSYYKEHGLQVEQIIRDSDAISFQVQQIVKTNKPNGLQVEQKVYEKDLTGIQLEQIVNTYNYLGLQTQQIVHTQKSSGLQTTMIRKLMSGFQTRMIVYNTTQLRIMWQFPSRGTPAQKGLNWTASSVATGDFSPNNLNTDIVEQVYRSAKGSHGYLELICDTGIPQGVAFDTLAILNHNLTSSAMVQVQGANEPTFSPPRFLFNMKTEAQNMFYIAPSFPTSLGQNRYWKFIFQNYTNPDEYIQIGTIIFGMSEIFSIKESFENPVIVGFKHFKDEIQTEGFTRVTNDRTLKKFIKLSFKNLNFYNGNYRILEEMIRFARTSLKCLVIPTPEAASRFAVFGKVSNLPEISTNYVDRLEEYVTLELEWDESL